MILVDYKRLGKRIRSERQKLRMTQQKLAEVINKSTSFTGMVERGDSILSLETLVSIANALGTTVDMLLEDSLVRKQADDAIDNEIHLYLSRMGRNEKLYFLNLLKIFVEYKKVAD